jgi:predicted metallo-beta-lactamase superfamily hydrolase
MQEDTAKINCTVFQKQELLMKGVTNKINMAKVVQEKARFAKELKKEVDVLLSCADYDSKRLDCEHCHFIANLRKKTANLIIKAKKLA